MCSTNTTDYLPRQLTNDGPEGPHKVPKYLPFAKEKKVEARTINIFMHAKLIHVYNRLEKHPAMIDIPTFPPYQK